MRKHQCRVLVLDWDEDVLVTLQHVLEDAGIDTTITWDYAEARTLICSQSFDILVVGDHPPDFSVDAILRDFNLELISCACLLLRVRPVASEQIRRLGISSIVPKGDPFRVLEQVQKYWQVKESNTFPTIPEAGSPFATTRLLESHKQAA